MGSHHVPDDGRRLLRGFCVLCGLRHRPQLLVDQLVCCRHHQHILVHTRRDEEERIWRWNVSASRSGSRSCFTLSLGRDR